MGQAFRKHRNFAFIQYNATESDGVGGGVGVEYTRMMDTSFYSSDASAYIPEKMNAKVTLVLCSE